MTEQEAIRQLNMLDEALNFQRADADESSCALQMAIKALEENQQYKAVGTFEEVKYHKRMLHLADMVVTRADLVQAELMNLLKCYRGDEDAQMKAFGFDEYIEKIIKMLD